MCYQESKKQNYKIVKFDNTIRHTKCNMCLSTLLWRQNSSVSARYCCVACFKPLSQNVDFMQTAQHRCTNYPCWKYILTVEFLVRLLA